MAGFGGISNLPNLIIEDTRRLLLLLLPGCSMFTPAVYRSRSVTSVSGNLSDVTQSFLSNGENERVRLGLVRESVSGWEGIRWPTALHF